MSDATTRVLVRPIGLDMVEVGGSNPPGPTKRETLAIGGGFSFEGYAGGDRRQRSTTCDFRSMLVARAQRRRPEGMRAREANALETIRLILPNVEPSPSAGVTEQSPRKI
jgi:hypothetical protein